MPRALIISYYFPPTGGAGAQRPSKFAKYLPGHGWDVCVVAPSLESVQGRWAPRDESLMSDIEGVRVERVGASKPPRHWSPVVDRQQAWAGAALDYCTEILRREHFDAVLVTMSPFSLAHCALELVRQSSAPVVVDLRDPWALDGWPTYQTRLHWERQHRFMGRVLREVDGVVANTREAAGAMTRAFGDDLEKKLLVLPNGFDPEDFDEAPPARSAGDRIVITHTGSLHSGELYPARGLLARGRRLLRHRPEPIIASGRTLVHLLSAVRRLHRRGYASASRLLVRCVGVQDAATERSVHESQVGEQVELVGYAPHRESVRALRDADMLFLPLHGFEDTSRRSLIVPGKAYEYIASGTPVLGCVPEGDARDLIQSYGAGVCADPCNEDAIADSIVRLCESGGSFRSAAPRPGFEGYSRRVLAGALAGFLDRVASGMADSAP